MFDKHNAPDAVKDAASIALGSISFGNVDKYLPFILNHLQSSASRRMITHTHTHTVNTYIRTHNYSFFSGDHSSVVSYFLLQALKEISLSFTDAELSHRLQTHLASMGSLVMAFAENSDEGVRGITAEIFGKLVILSPQTLMPLLIKNLDSDNAFCK